VRTLLVFVSFLAHRTSTHTAHTPLLRFAVRHPPPTPPLPPNHHTTATT
jgi:hypothetical protein